MQSPRRFIKQVKAALWPKLTRRLPWNCQMSYSQFGEDMLLSWLFRGRKGAGLYADIGAFHPVALSNTYALYCRGWRGICVEPRAAAHAEFAAYRPRDINLRLAVTPAPTEKVEFFTFADATRNTIDAEDAARTEAAGHQLVGREAVEAITLTQLFERHLPAGAPLDLLSIDVEGVDEAILRSNDWARHRPGVLVFESRGASYREVPALPLVGFLEGHGYELVTKCGESVIMRQAGGA